HRLRLRCPVAVPGGAHVAALPAGVIGGGLPKRTAKMPFRSIRLLIAWLAPVVVLSSSPGFAASQWVYDEVIDSPMYKSPELPVRPVEITFPEGAIALWVKALGRPEVDLKCQAAQAVSKAQRRGVKGLEVTVAPLLEALDKPDQHPTVRLAVAEA